MELLIFLLIVIAVITIWGMSHNSKIKKKRNLIDAFYKCNKEITELLSKYKPFPKKTYFYDPVNINLSYEDSIKLESLKEINLKNAKSLSYNGLMNLSDTIYGEDDSCDCCKSADDKHLFEFEYLRIDNFSNQFKEEAQVSYRGLYCNNCGYISPFNGKPLRFILD